VTCDDLSQQNGTFQPPLRLSPNAILAILPPRLTGCSGKRAMRRLPEFITDLQSICRFWMQIKAERAPSWGRTRVRSHEGAERQRRVAPKAANRAVLPLLFFLIASPLAAQTVPLAGDVTAVARPELLASGYVETHVGYNFNQPYRGLTAMRGYDNRDATFVLDNVVLGAAWQRAGMQGLIALQAGNTPHTYYGLEPKSEGSGGVPASGPEAWRNIQQAWVGFQAGAWTTQAGLFLTPIGPEHIAVRDNWNWSRSNLFYTLPVYLTGAKVSWSEGAEFRATAMLCNGWNSVVDNNQHKSILLMANGAVGRLSYSGLYMGGIERSGGGLEGEPWRHLIDGYLTFAATTTISLQLHGDGGWESTDIGQSSWLAAAAYLRWAPDEKWAIAGRADFMRESLASTPFDERAKPILFPATLKGRTGLVASATLTVEYRPVERLSVRAEVRGDAANSDIYFDSSVTPSVGKEAVPNAFGQPTALLGATAWF